MEPFLRWAGGKRWLSPTLAPIIKNLLDQSSGVYAEPFLGSAAMFFGLAPQKAILSDSNAHLICTYQQIATNYQKIVSILSDWPVNADFYYKLRNDIPDTKLERAARFIYLNRTCYGGLYRENRSGLFNTPYGGGSRTPEGLLKKQLLEKAHFALSNVKLVSCDFSSIISNAGEGDVVYCDPTYSNVTKDAFDRYGASVFNWEDQIRLAYSAQEAMDNGATVIVSNGCFSQLIELYPAAYRITLERKKALGKTGVDCAKNLEYLLILDPLNRKKTWEKLGCIENRKSKKRIKSVGKKTNSPSLVDSSLNEIRLQKTS